MPFLSVVMPLHNGAKWLGATLDSLVAQDERDFECVLIDSSPDEATLRVAEAYAGRLDMRILRLPDMKPWPEKTNHAVSIARAPHVSMLHQDDLWAPGRAAAARRWIEAAPATAMHLHPVDFIDERGLRRGSWRCPLPSDGAPTPPAMLLERLLVQNFIAIPAPVIRADAWLAAGGMREDLWYTADWDLYLRIAGVGDVIHHDETLASFRVHGNSLTISGSARASDFENQMRVVLDAHAGRLPPDARARVLARADASIRVNTCLAGAYNGSPTELARAALALLRLGPLGLAAYLRDSRLVERIGSRLRARLAGGL